MMKLKNAMLIFSIFLIILCIGSVSASQNDTELGIDDGDVAVESEDIDEISQDIDTQNTEVIADTNSSDTSSAPSTDANETNQTKTEAYVTGSTEFIKNSNKYVKIKIYTIDDSNKVTFQKNVKLTVKIKIGKKTKTIHVKTDSNGVAKVLNVKKLKAGSYKITVRSNDKRYSFKDTDYISIYNKKQKTITLKTNKRKKVKGDYIDTVYVTKNGEFKKGVYAGSYNAKKPLDGNPHTLIMKAKFFFKNKKTGETKTVTVKTKDNAKYLYKEQPYTKLIKGYTPVKTKIWYVTI